VIKDATSSGETSAEAGLQRATAHAVALKATLPEAPPVFTAAERGLLVGWLDRLIREV
jgi:hypothetical protein